MSFEEFVEDEAHFHEEPKEEIRPEAQDTGGVIDDQVRDDVSKDDEDIGFDKTKSLLDRLPEEEKAALSKVDLTVKKDLEEAQKTRLTERIKTYLLKEAHSCTYISPFGIIIPQF